MPFDYTLFLSILASIGLCFAGSSLLSINLVKMTGSYLYNLILKGTKTPTRAFFSGIGINSIVNKSSALSSILVSMVSSGTINLQNAIFLLLGGNIGAMVLFYLLSIKMELVVLFLIGVSGIWFGFIREGEGKYIGRAFFGLSLLLYGIFVMHSQITPDQMGFIRSFFVSLETQQSYFSFIIGVITQLLLQTGTIIMVLQMQLLETGALDLSHILLIQCGTRLGSLIMIGVNNIHFQGTALKVILVQVILSGIVIFGSITLLIIEKYTGIPLIIGLIQKTTSQPSLQVVNLALYTSLFSTLLLLICHRFLFKLLDRVGGKEKPNPALPLYIRDATLEDPISSLLLVNKEQVRVIQNVYDYLQGIRNLIEQDTAHQAKHVTPACTKLNKEIEKLLGNLLAHSDSKITFNRILNQISMNSSIHYIIQTMSQFRNLVYKDLTNDEGHFKKTFLDMVEALDFLIYASLDALNNPTEENVELLFNVSHDRTKFISESQAILLSNIEQDHIERKQVAIDVLGYFERFIWLFREAAIGLRKELEFQKEL